MGFLGGLVNAAVGAVGGGLRGQNEGDDELYRRRQVEHEQALREYAAQQQEKRQAARDQLEAGLIGAETENYQRRNQEWQPTTEQERLDLEGAQHPVRPPAPRNIDPNSEAGINARLEYDRRRLRPTSFSRTPGEGGGAGNVKEELKNLNSVIDDTDRELGKARSAVPRPWDSTTFAINPSIGDSTTYTRNRDRLTATADSIQGVRDQFATKRNGLVADQFGMNGPTTPGGQTSGSGGAGSTTVRPGTGAGSAKFAAQRGGWEQQKAAIEQLTAQYQRALAARGPNGERKDPALLQQRYLAALDAIEKGQ